MMFRSAPLLIVVGLMLLSPAARAVPTSIPYTGYLTVLDGQPYDGNVTVTAALYGSESGDDLIWGPEDLGSVAVDGGVLSFTLGADGGLEGTIANEDVLYLSIALDGTPLEPRQQVLSVPYAIRAGLADDADRLGGVDAGDYALKGDLATVATSGSYDDLLGLPEVLLPDGTVPLAGDWDLGGHGLSGVVIAPADAPVVEIQGALWFDTTASSIKVYDGVAWQALDAGAAVGEGQVVAWIEAAGYVDADDFAAHTAEPSAHHAKTTSFSELTDSAMDDQIPDDITVVKASDSELLDGVDSTAFESAGTAATAVAGHEAATPHLTQAERDGLVGGPTSNADEYHTHDLGGAAGTANAALFNSTFTHQPCAADTPVALLDLGEDVSMLTFPAQPGEVLSGLLDVDVMHADPASLVIKLESPGGAEVFDVTPPDGTGLWTIDVTSEVAGMTATEGDWTLLVQDLIPDGQGATLNSWCLELEVFSSDTVGVTGRLLVDGGDVGSRLAALEAAETLASLVCTPQEIARWDGSSWGCETDQVLSDSEVETIVSNANYLTENDFLVGEFGLRGVVASDTLRASADSQRSKTNDTSPTVVKDVTMRLGGTIRVRADVAGYKWTGDHDDAGTAQVVVDGVNCGATLQPGNGAYEWRTSTRDCPVEPGGRIRLTYKTTGDYEIRVRNFRVSYDMASLSQTSVVLD